MHLVQDRKRWQVLVNTEGLCSMLYVSFQFQGYTASNGKVNVNELKKIRKFVVCFKATAFYWGIRKTTKYISQNSLSPG